MPTPLETRKDTVQEVVESGATHVGRIATIITGAVRDVARELGDWATDVFEMREASQLAQADRQAEVAERGADAESAGPAEGDRP
ncbi:hypothetical protein PAI11_12870 [Patulibacter medicamentivorans]|uniref:Uncharacterized protein n=1 Tax=Patulibacter medicamentivorans TaxID=1097667 RepID=H0E3B9_9ACTN|nr:hypothetical protein [Patulibacter medicamentivorans]EHN11828.1 hypothetical protein PAI11_12870 [Patulibacter medicamentivorans]